MNNEKENVEKLKELFDSSLTEFEIKQKLNLSNSEYHKILKIVKKELGLPSNYRRSPRSYDKYNPQSYYVLSATGDDLEILTYRPSKKSAEDYLKEYLKDNREDIGSVGYTDYRVEKATDENMMKIIRELYSNQKMNWENIIQKTKLPYHVFYDFLNNLKKESNTIQNQTNNEHRYIYYYHPTNKYVIRKRINGKYKCYGYYPSREEAEHMRSYLEANNWDVELFKENRYKIMEEAESSD